MPVLRAQPGHRVSFRAQVLNKRARRRRCRSSSCCCSAFSRRCCSCTDAFGLHRGQVCKDERAARDIETASDSRPEETQLDWAQPQPLAPIDFILAQRDLVEILFETEP